MLENTKDCFVCESKYFEPMKTALELEDCCSKKCLDKKHEVKLEVFGWVNTIREKSKL